MINGGYFNKDICISLDITTEKINRISYIGMIFHFIKGANYTPWVRTSLLISFEAFTESHKTQNILIFISIKY